MEILVTTLAGLEEVLAEELRTMGATEVHVRKRAVACVGDQSLLYRANWMLRTAIRVLLPLHQFKARHPDQLYRGIQDIDWSQYLRPSDTLAVDAVARSEVFTHSHFVALKTKDAIVDQLRNRYGRRPSVDTHSPNYRINVHIFDTNVAVSLDSSGHSLHKRGYRVANVMAPLNEVLAAGLVLLSGWQPGQTLIDPFCGSGTILTEAALLAKNRSPQHARREFGFMKWLDYDAGLWRSTRENARKAETPIEGQILGSDIDRGAVSAARKNIAKLNLSDHIKIQEADFKSIDLPEGGGVLIGNPPYDERLPLEDAVAFYQSIGDWLKQRAPGYTAWILSGHLDAIKQLGLRASRKIPLRNGNLDCKFQRYELYVGSKKTT